MKATGYLLTAGAVAAGAVAAGAVAALVVVALIWSFSQRPSPVAATQSPSATPTASTPTPTASAAASAPTQPSAPATGVITGRIGYPSEFAPPLTAYAISVNDPNVWYSTNTPFFGSFTRPTPSPTPSFAATWPPEGQGMYQLSVPAGTYYVVGYNNDTGLPKDLPVGYTEWAMKCSSSDPAQPPPPAGPCPYPRTLVPVTVAAGQTVRFIDLVDWAFQGGAFPPRPTPR